eukprot:1786803-Rhodomonas_salina.1
MRQRLHEPKSGPPPTSRENFKSVPEIETTPGIRGTGRKSSAGSQRVKGARVSCELKSNQRKRSHWDKGCSDRGFLHLSSLSGVEKSGEEWKLGLEEGRGSEGRGAGL